LLCVSEAGRAVERRGVGDSRQRPHAGDRGRECPWSLRSRRARPQKEVLSGELTELKNGVAQALSVLRRLGTITDSIRLDSRQAQAALEVVLGSVMHVQDVGEKYLMFPALKRGGKADEQIFGDIKEDERQWRGQARAIIERAKRKAEDEF
jgi:hypothetical protein